MCVVTPLVRDVVIWPWLSLRSFSYHALPHFISPTMLASFKFHTRDRHVCASGTLVPSSWHGMIAPLSCRDTLYKTAPPHHHSSLVLLCFLFGFFVLLFCFCHLTYYCPVTTTVYPKRRLHGRRTLFRLPLCPST